MPTAVGNTLQDTRMAVVERMIVMMGLPGDCEELAVIAIFTFVSVVTFIMDDAYPVEPSRTRR